MIFDSDKLQKIRLIMFEKTMMADSDMVEVGGKKSFVKNGKMSEYTTYTFRDGSGDKLEILSKNNDYRNLEGEIVDVSLDVSYDGFSRRVKTKLASVKKSDPTLA